MKPILSISLLCSGRKETTKKCLDSLKPIMEQVASELIIVDTGCDDDTRTLLQEYTDHIVPFTWCDDFSKARNAGLKEAKGEWFLYIDDDEWFEDTQEIITFFRGGEHRKYGVACYIQRNYMDIAGNTYMDVWVSRMIKLRKETRFLDRIHEYLFPVYGSNRLVNSWVAHYGYAYKNAEEERRHNERNILLLSRTIEEEPKNWRARAHLAQEYYGQRDDWPRMEEFCKETLEMLQKPGKDYVQDSYRQTFYLGRMLALTGLQKIEEAEEFFVEAVSDKRIDELGRAGLCQLAADAYYRKKEYETCDRCCREYIRVFDAEGGRINKIPPSPIFTQNIFYVASRNGAYCLYICSRLAQDDTEILKKYFWKLGWGEGNFTILEHLIPGIVDAFARLPFEEEFVPIARTLIEDRKVSEITIDLIRKKIKNCNEDVLYSLARVFGQVNSDHYIIRYLKVFYAAEEQNREEVEETCRWIFRKVEDALILDDAFFAVADEYELALDEILAGIPFDQWRTEVNALCERNPMNIVRKRTEFMERHCQEGNVRFDYFMMKVSEAEAVVTTEYKDYSIIREQMKTFSDRSMNFYERFFRREAFEGEMEMLPAPGRVARHLRDALKAEEAGDITAFREALTKAIGIFGPIDGGLQHFGKLYASHREAQLEESRRAGDEMKSLARQIKRQIYRFIDMGDKKTAYSVWQQLKAITPDDPELVELEKRCQE